MLEVFESSLPLIQKHILRFSKLCLAALQKKIKSRFFKFQNFFFLLDKLFTIIKPLNIELRIIKISRRIFSLKNLKAVFKISIRKIIFNRKNLVSNFGYFNRKNHDLKFLFLNVINMILSV